MSLPTGPRSVPEPFDPAATPEPSRLAETFREKSGQIVDEIGDTASQVAQRASAGASSLGKRLGDAATTLRENVPESLAPYADRASAAAKRAANYVSDTDFQAYGDEVATLVRRHPLPAMLTGVAIGFLIARGSRR
jgi:ElaB/YqjD/DUF883 family membrane-anchored ribosome-binding protein